MLVSTVPICMSVYLSVCPFVYLSFVHLNHFIQFLSVIHFLSFWSIANSNLSNSVAMALLSPGTVWNKNRWKKREKRKEGKREREKKGRKEREREKKKEGRKEIEREAISTLSHFGMFLSWQYNKNQTKKTSFFLFGATSQLLFLCFSIFTFK